MQVIEILIDFFGLNSEIVTFVDFAMWFSKLLLAVTVMAIIFKACFSATWKIERSLR